MNENPVFNRIRQEIGSSPVVAYLRGSIMFPLCGGSALMGEILTHMGVRFLVVDVNLDPSLKEGLKDFSNCQDMPQLYVRGELIVCGEAIRELYQSGELAKILQNKQIEFTSLV